MAAPNQLTLYAETLWVSPYVFSSFVTLREKGVPFAVVHVNLQVQAQQRPAYRDRSITAKVPALEHDGFWLAESSAIAEYLEETFPAPAVFPAPVRDRARVRQIMAWLRSDLAALRNDRPTVSIFIEPTAQPLSKAGAEDAAKLVRVAEQLVPADGGPLFGAWSLADAELALMLQRLILNRDPVPERIQRYAAAQWQRPSVQEFVTHARPAERPEVYGGGR